MAVKNKVRHIIKRLSACIFLSAFLFTSSYMVSWAAATTELDFVTLSGDISEKNYNRMIANYCKIPLNVRENFQLAGWTIVMTDDRLEDVWNSPVSICAVSDGAAKEIILEDTKNGSNAIVHEVAHYVDWTLGWVSYSEEWKEIWEEEVTSKYGKTNPVEGFAEAFDCSMMEKNYKDRCPQSYEFIMNCCSQLEGVSDIEGK